MNNEFPFISIIIPTYNREKMLGITLDSFLNQDYAKNRLEIIVANNNSSDGTEGVILDFQKKYPDVIKYIFEKRQGVHFARNTAARKSRGDILYFTDDDMIADPALIKNLVSVFKLGYNIGAATGRVLPKWEAPPPKWLVKYCSNAWLSLNHLSDKLIISLNDIGVFSCHQAILREAFFKSGGFNPENTAGEWIGDGETGLNIKIKEMGYCFAYVDDSIIYHMIPPSRMTQAYLNKRLANQGNCDSYTEFRKNKFSKNQLCIQITSHFLNFFKDVIKSLVKIFLSKTTFHMTLALFFYYLNRVKFDYKLLTDKRWQELVLKKDWLNE